MSLTVRERSLWNRMQNEKFSGRAYAIPGLPHFVRPTTDYQSYDVDAFAANHHVKVYDTLDLALAACVAGRGDAIVLFPGNHTPTASLAMSKAGVSIWGPEAWMGVKVRKPSASITGVTADQAMNITAPNCMIIGITCIPITAQSFADFSALADGLVVKDCYIDLVTPVVNIATEGFTGLAAAENILFEGNTVWSDGAQGPALEITGANLNCLIKGNHFHVDTGSWASAVNLISPDGILVEENDATCGGTAMTACFTGSGTTVIGGVVFKRNVKGVLVTLLVDGFATASHAELVSNHTATVGLGTGETLVTAVT